MIAASKNGEKNGEKVTWKYSNTSSKKIDSDGVFLDLISL